MGFRDIDKSYALFCLLHLAEFILAITVIGLYGTDLDRARKAHVYSDGKWVYAVVIASLSAVTSILWLFRFFLRFAFVPIWNFILFVAWIVLFAIFGALYIHENPEGNGDIQRMKNAVWVDLANVLLWLIGTVASAAYWWFHRQRHTRFTGRAKL